MTLWECLTPEVMQSISRIAARFRSQLGTLYDSAIDVDDIVQSSLLRVLRHQEKTFASEADFVRWMTAVVRSAMIDELRKGRHNPHSIDDIQEVESPQMKRRELSEDELERALRELGQVSPISKQIVEKRLEGMTFPDIAESLKISPFVAQRHYATAPDKLAAIIRSWAARPRPDSKTD